MVSNNVGKRPPSLGDLITYPGPPSAARPDVPVMGSRPEDVVFLDRLSHVLGQAHNMAGVSSVEGYYGKMPLNIQAKSTTTFPLQQDRVGNLLYPPVVCTGTLGDAAVNLVLQIMAEKRTDANGQATYTDRVYAQGTIGTQTMKFSVENKRGDGVFTEHVEIAGTSLDTLDAVYPTQALAEFYSKDPNNSKWSSHLNERLQQGYDVVGFSHGQIHSGQGDLPYESMYFGASADPNKNPVGEYYFPETSSTSRILTQGPDKVEEGYIGGQQYRVQLKPPAGTAVRQHAFTGH